MKKLRNVIPTEITVNLTTGFNHYEDDTTAQTREQLEYIGFYTQALFRMVKAAIENLGDFDDKDIQWTLYDITHTCDLGVGIAAAISPLLDVFDTDGEPETIEQNEIEKPVRIDADSEVEIFKAVEKVELAARQTAEIASLALQLSAVLNNQNLPVEIYNSVMDVVGEIYNKGDNEILNKFESSPEYLKALLLAYAKREVSH